MSLDSYTKHTNFSSLYFLCFWTKHLSEIGTSARAYVGISQRQLYNSNTNEKIIAYYMFVRNMHACLLGICIHKAV